MADSETSHLAYYQAHDISPVRYDLSDLRAHLQRRASLYHRLGMPELAFKGLRVLEVAPGSGQNSLFLAGSGAVSLDLVEPNPAGIRDIRATYDKYGDGLLAPTLHELPLQAFDPAAAFDVVICENWLGSLPNERELRKKLAGFVAPKGVLVMTVVPVAGFLPNVLRKLMAGRVAPAEMDFDEKTQLLTHAFASHLETIPDMTRSHEDWVRDCMINPHYLNVELSLETVLEDVGAGMEVLGSCPTFQTDWRWFKSLYGSAKRFNDVYRAEYMKNLHNFMDYRFQFPVRGERDNEDILRLCTEIHADARRAEQGDAADAADILARIATSTRALARQCAPLSEDLATAYDEAADALASRSLDADAIRSMTAFKGVFGRETIYLSLVRQDGAAT